MITIAVLAILFDLMSLQSKKLQPGSTCKLMMALIHAGFGVFAAVEIIRRKFIAIAYLGSIVSVGAWFWILVVLDENNKADGFGVLGTLAGVGVAIWTFLTLLNQKVVGEFQGIRQVANPREMLNEVYDSKPVFYSVSGALALLPLLLVISMVQSGKEDKDKVPTSSRDRIETLQASDPSKRMPLDKRLIGKWELVQGGNHFRWIDYDKTTLEITTSGNVLFSESGKYNEEDSPPASYHKGQPYKTNWSAKAWALEDGTVEFQMEGEHIFRLSPDFIGENELLLVKTGKYSSEPAFSVVGKWRKAKP